MKRRLLAVLLSVFAFSAFTFGFTACKNTSDGKDGADGKDGIDGIDGTDGEDGKDGEDGADGKDGAGVLSAYVDENGYLILILTNGKKINCGKVRDDDGVYTESFSYSEITDGDEVVGYELTGIEYVYSEDLIIPTAYNGKPVLAVADNAFNGCADIKSVTIPDSVITIGESAFYNCTALTSVYVGSGVTEIGNLAFAKCTGVEEVYIYDLGAWCDISFGGMASNPLYFAENLYIDNQPATVLEIPDTVKAIGDYAFYECSNITEVKTGNGAISIGESAFYNCQNLKSVTVGESVKSIGNEAFANCANLETAELGGSVETIGEYAFSDCVSLTEMEIPSSVESIGNCAFTNCSSLSSVALNEGLKNIGDCAFGGCRNLGSFIMPDSVTSIGWGVLVFDSGAVGFAPGDSTNSLTELVISNSITEIPDFAFSKSNILSVEIGDKVETIRYSSFYGCGLMQSVVIPKSLTKVESYAFYNCVALESVFYKGTAEDWSKISIGRNGNDISTAIRYYYSETQPERAGNYWHYVEGIPTVW